MGSINGGGRRGLSVARKPTSLPPGARGDAISLEAGDARGRVARGGERRDGGKGRPITFVRVFVTI